MEILGMGAIVTGGASGLGAATARNLAANGARVSIFDLDPERGLALATEIGGLFSQVDVSDETSVADGIAQAEDRHGIARILVNCAGICPAARTIGKDGQPHSMDIYRRAIDVNLVGTFNMASKVAARAASAEALDGERGVIVNTASVAGMVGLPKRASYSASKGAVIALTRQVAVEYVEQGIRVNCLCPGTVDSPWVGRLLQQADDPVAARQALVARQPLGRLGTPEEIAAAALYLVSDDAAFITGTGLVIDGGLTAR